MKKPQLILIIALLTLLTGSFYYSNNKKQMTNNDSDKKISFSLRDGQEFIFNDQTLLLNIVHPPTLTAESAKAGQGNKLNIIYQITISSNDGTSSKYIFNENNSISSVDLGNRYVLSFLGSKDGVVDFELQKVIPDTYSINGTEVEQKIFEEMKSKLNISKEVSSSASIESNPSDPIAYPAGTEANYDATDKITGKKYRYTIISYPRVMRYEITELESKEVPYTDVVISSSDFQGESKWKIGSTQRVSWTIKGLPQVKGELRTKVFLVEDGIEDGVYGRIIDKTSKEGADNATYKVGSINVGGDALAGLSPGTYKVVVGVYEMPRGPQHFAIAGNLISEKEVGKVVVVE